MSEPTALRRSHFTPGRSLASALLLSAAILVALPGVGAAQAPGPERNIALIVGNGDYEVLADLPNAPRDAVLVTEYFQSLGYETVSLENADFRTLSTAISDVAGRTDEDSTVVFYFAGHGLQVGTGNFLLPSDSRIDGLHDLPFAALSLSHLMSVLSTRAKHALFILDSCRDNPFLNEMVVDSLDNSAKPVESGFFFQRSPIDTFTAFSTSPGELALDGPEGGNSPFTSALVSNARANPGADITTLMARTRRDVHMATRGLQLPWESSSLTTAVALDDVPRPIQVAGAPLVPSAPSAGDAGRAAEVTETVVEIEEQFEREIAVGARLVEHLTGDPIELLETPTGGDVAVVDEGHFRVLRAGDRIERDELGSVIFRPRVQRYSSAELDTLTRFGGFSMASPGARANVELALPVHACDLETGGVLDPQGIGAEIEPHELRPVDALRACRAAVASDPDNPRFRAQLARALAANGDIDGARAELVTAIEGGHIRATQRIGVLEILAQAQAEGIEQMPAPPDAMQFLEAGHRLGDPLADYSLGRELLRYGEGDAAKRRGYALLSRAHSAGYIEAINELARYFLQEGAEHFNPDRALRYFQATAERGNINGQNSLGVIYRRGLAGVSPDKARAAAEFEAAADGGHPAAPNVLGIMYEDGDGVSQDFTRALSWYDTGLDRGDPWGGANGALMILRKNPPGLSRFDAAKRAGRSAALGTGRASERALELLGELSARDISAGAQALLNDLGASLSVDGDFGPASMAALSEVLGPEASGLSASAPLDILLAVAAAHWEAFGFRVDIT
ncbi:MAG: caspase family protein [Pseudomonadota bacterium]